MSRLEPRNLNLTKDQVREFMSGQCNVRNVNPGDVITWSCGYYDENNKKCDYQVQENVTEYAEAPDWPDWLIDHIWQEGHMTIMNSMGTSKPFVVYEKAKWYGPMTVAVGMTIFNIGFFLGVVLGMR